MPFVSVTALRRLGVTTLTSRSPSMQPAVTSVTVKYRFLTGPGLGLSIRAGFLQLQSRPRCRPSPSPPENEQDCQFYIPSDSPDEIDEFDHA